MGESRFIASYLGNKRKYGEKIAEVVKNTGCSTLVDMFGGSGSLTCQLAPYFKTVIYNDKNKYISLFIYLAITSYREDRFDSFWEECMAYFISDKESYMKVRTMFNESGASEEQKSMMYFWLNNTCTSALVRWNKNKIPGNPWYFNQAYCGKKVDAEGIKSVLLDGVKSVNNCGFIPTSFDYQLVMDSVFRHGAYDVGDGASDECLILCDPPYDNTYSGYIPEDWHPGPFVDWVSFMSEHEHYKMCLFGTTKTDDFSDTMNLKPFYDAGWKVLVLSEKAFKGVSPHSDKDNKQDRSKQRDVMLYNF